MAVTIYGASAVSFMMVMYALESRSRQFIAAFALGCALSSSYGFLAGTWPFGVIESVWSLVALRRYLTSREGSKTSVPGIVIPDLGGSDQVRSGLRGGSAASACELAADVDVQGI